jgi:site-specific DNA-methyltransferase (adenine-specific)
MKIETRSIGSLLPDSRNARKHGKRNLATIRASLEQFGQQRAAVIRSDGTVLAGNGMLEAARSLGWTELAVTVVPDEWPDEQARAYALADNRTGELAEWDVAVLDEHLVELEVAGLDIEALGFDRPDKPYSTDDYEEELPEPPPEPVTVVGDLWQVGPHRIICGDSSDPLVLDRLLKGVKVGCVLTDPPYGIDLASSGKRKDGKVVSNDDLSKSNLEVLLSDSLGLAYARCEAGASWYVFAPPDDKFGVFARVLEQLPGAWRHTLVWVKDQFSLGRQDYHYRHEAVFYGWKEGAGHSWFGGRKQDSVLLFDRPKRSPEHPTMKPLDLLWRLLRNNTEANAVVFDPFAGSGSTLVACAHLERVGYGVELDPAYVDIIVSRLEKATGEKAVRVDG